MSPLVVFGRVGLSRGFYVSASAILGGSGWARVGRVRLPKICFSLFVLFKKWKHQGNFDGKIIHYNHQRGVDNG